jgi:hypothetical protein
MKKLMLLSVLLLGCSNPTSKTPTLDMSAYLSGDSDSGTKGWYVTISIVNMGDVDLKIKSFAFSPLDSMGRSISSFSMSVCNINTDSIIPIGTIKSYNVGGISNTLTVHFIAHSYTITSAVDASMSKDFNFPPVALTVH